VSLTYLPYKLSSSEEQAYSVLLEVYKQSVNAFSEAHSLSALLSICYSAEDRPSLIGRILDQNRSCVILCTSVIDRESLQDYFHKVGVYTHSFCEPMSPIKRSQLCNSMSNCDIFTCLTEPKNLPLPPPCAKDVLYVIPPQLLTPYMAGIPSNSEIYVPVCAPNLPSIEAAFVSRYQYLIQGASVSLQDQLSPSVTNEIASLFTALPQKPALPAQSFT